MYCSLYTAESKVSLYFSSDQSEINAGELRGGSEGIGTRSMLFKVSAVTRRNNSDGRSGIDRRLVRICSSSFKEINLLCSNGNYSETDMCNILCFPDPSACDISDATFKDHDKDKENMDSFIFENMLNRNANQSLSDLILNLERNSRDDRSSKFC